MLLQFGECFIGLYFGYMKIKSSVFTHTHSKMQKHGKQPDNVWQKKYSKREPPAVSGTAGGSLHEA